MANALTIALYGARRRKVLYSIAYDYAYMSIQRVATVRRAPTFTPEHEAAWRDHRDALLSVKTWGELPAVPDPAWPVRHLQSDYVTTKFHDVHTKGMPSFRVIDAQKVRKGVKPLPTYSNSTTSKAATEWAASFCLMAGLGANS